MRAAASEDASWQSWAVVRSGGAWMLSDVLPHL